ncbi:hypothetical protein L208DRAFT_1384742 [Tricholoma matsutake]|nr:hypothetical protein L208DRAFT_1384742 [Tricholoma matsutake 945]
MASYSAFFSSGLLAPPSTQYKFNYDKSSPIIPSSSLPDSDIEVDTEHEDTPTRVLPPTPQLPAQSSTRPRLRKRRSSLTIRTSPMTAIRSPTRNAGAALQLQLHLTTSPSRSRSGSFNRANETGIYNGGGIGNIASESTSLVGRMRSGSVGSILRPRMAVRRLAFVPAPAPPPTAPLPAIPSLVPAPSSKLNSPPPVSAPFSSALPSCHSTTSTNTNIAAGSVTSARPPLATWRSSSDAALSAVKDRDRSFLVGMGYSRIDEDMKEN